MAVPGLITIVAGVALLLAEAHLSSGGILGSGAALALVGGVALMLAGGGAGLAVVLAVSALAALACLGVLVLLARSVRPLRGMAPRSGIEAMAGHLGVVRVGDRAMQVFVDGGLWRAHPSPLEPPGSLRDGDQVVVERARGLTLFVRKADELELYR